MMTRERKLLQQALDALLTGYHQGTQDAIAALREALAAPEPEPVAEVYRARYGRRARNVGVDDVRKLNGVALPPLGTKLYAAPPAAPDHLRDVAEKAAPAAPVPDGWVMVPRGLLRRLIAEALTFDPSLQDKEAIEQAKQLAASPAAPAAPPAAPAPAQPVPLTQDQIADCTRTAHRACDAKAMTRWSTEFARAIEAAHGITGGSK